MALIARDRASANRWKGIFALSWLLAAFFLWPSLGRFSDGDDSYLFYDAGLRSWGEVLGMTVLPPGIAPVTAVPELGSGRVPEAPVFVFGRWRPFSQFVYIKALWTLGLTPKAYRILSWLLCWLASLSLGWGAASVFSLVEEVPPETPWVLATLLFWSVPTLFPSSIAFFSVNLASLLIGLGMTLLCRGGSARGPRAWEITAAGVLGFFACESHENTWGWLVWLAVFLGVLRVFRKLRPQAPRFWWPLALLLGYVVVFRSFRPESGPNWTGSGSANYSFAPAVVWSHFSYLILAPLNGLSRPFVSLLGADLSSLDVDPAGYPLAFVLTFLSLTAVVVRNFSRRAGGARAEPWVGWAFGATLAVGAATILPYCCVSNLRFIYYSKLLSDLLVIGIVFLWLRISRPRGLLLVPWMLAGGLTLALTTAHPSWLERNARDSEQSVRELVGGHPELKACESRHPCCISGLPRRWGLNEWVLSYNLGSASKIPAFYPEGWPGARCEGHLTIGPVD